MPLISGNGILFPTWVAVFVFGIWPAIYSWQRRQKRRRVNAEFCAGCGYDLRASPQRCPECGIEAIRGEGAGL